jgi:hypothetical protein
MAIRRAIGIKLLCVGRRRGEAQLRGAWGFIHGFQYTGAALSDDATGGFSAIVSADNTVKNNEASDTLG